jgi:hypothetical protein
MSAVRDAALTPAATSIDGDDLVAWGEALTEMVGTLASSCQVLERLVAHYGDQRVLSDDLGADPYERLGEMRRHLAALIMALSESAVQAQAYHSAATHIGVQVDPNAGLG